MAQQQVWTDDIENLNPGNLPNIIPNPSSPEALSGSLLAISDEGTYKLVTPDHELGTGNVVGPNDSLDNRIVTFNGTTGVLIKDSGVSFPIPINQGGTGATDLAQAKINLEIKDGDVVGPAGIDPVISGNLAAFDGTTGQLIADAGFTLPIPTSLDVNQVIQVDAEGQYVLGSAGSGDVVGPSGSSPGTLPIFSDSTGKSLTNSLVGFPIPVNQGGTGAITPAAARTNLDAQEAGEGASGNIVKWGVTNTLTDAGFGIPTPVGVPIGNVLSTNGSSFVFVTPEIGDITNVIAGTGLSGGGTSGAITLDIANTGVTADTYAFPKDLIVNDQGQITSVNSGSQPITALSTGTPDILSVSGLPPFVSVDLDGIVPLGNGGTGTDLSTAPLGTLFYADGAGALVQIAPGTPNQVLAMDSAGFPVWTSV